jgi:argininosuccinate lyase
MTETKNLWGGRFTEKANETFAEFNNSFRFDKRLFAADVRCSIEYAEGLFRAGILSRSEAQALKNGLQKLLKLAAADANYFKDSTAEDVHSFIETKLIELVGDTGRKLHTGRSRNDQVASVFRLWLREEIEEISQITKGLQKALIDSAERQKEAILPGYTHLQRAQPIPAIGSDCAKFGAGQIFHRSARERWREHIMKLTAKLWQKIWDLKAFR